MCQPSNPCPDIVDLCARFYFRILSNATAKTMMAPRGKLLPKCRDAQQHQSIAQHAHDSCADDHSADGPFATHQAGAANDRSGNGIQFISLTANGLRNTQSRHQQNSRHGGGKTGNGIRNFLDSINRNAVSFPPMA